MTATIPSSQQPISGQGGYINQTWLRFFNNLLGVASPTPIMAVSPTGSPFSYTAPSWGSVSVSGGTVSAISLTRNTATISTGVTSGIIPVAGGDVVTVTYSGPPAVSFIPA